MVQDEYHDADFTMRARFYVETKCPKEVVKPKKNGRKANRVARPQGNSRGRPTESLTGEALSAP